MCDSKGKWLSLLVGGFTGSYLSNMSYKKAQRQDQAQINAANQAAANQIELNKKANSTQTTGELDNPTTTTDKLKQQKIPLNTANTGAAMGSQTSVGLNLGGY